MKALRIHTWLIVLGLLFFMTFGKAAFADEPSRILILPFNIYAEKDISFLKSGIWDMLSTRLYHEGTVSIISKNESQSAAGNAADPINESMAVTAGGKLSADYVLFGSITVFGDSISTDARFIHVPTRSTKVTFNRSGTQQGDAILHINEFAGTINATVFGRIAGIAPAATPVVREQDALPENRMNPEVLWKQEKGGIPAADKLPAPQGPAAPSVNQTPVAAVAPPTVQRPIADHDPSFWRSPEFSFKINGMAVGDVDGDRMPEVVFITQRDIYVYRITKGGIESFSVIKGKRTSNLISIDVADINKNGKDEIFVTNFLTENAVNNSFVLEWDGHNFNTISEKQPWYFRVIKDPGNNPLLLGQKRGWEDKFFSGPVERLAYGEGGFSAVESVNLPEGINLYAFGIGDALNANQKMVVTYTYDDRIKIISESGSEDLTAENNYGGGGVLLEAPHDRNMNSKEGSRYYIHQRLFVADLDNDGKNEIVAVKNIDSAGRLFKRFRLYKTGIIEGLQWNSMGFDKKMETKETSGYIADYAVTDLNGDGKRELLYVVVKGGGPLFGREKSFMVYEPFHN